MRLLFVGPDPAWQAAVGEAAVRLGADLVAPTACRTVLRRLLEWSAGFTHLLIDPTLPADKLDALTAMSAERPQDFPAIVRLSVRAGCGRPEAACVESALDAAVPGRMTMPPMTDAELRAALHGGALRTVYQPLVAAADGRLVGVEALARLHDPVRGVLHPEHFIGPVEAAGLTRTLTVAMAVTALRELRGFLVERGVRLAVNVPLPTLMSAVAVRRCAAMCAGNGIAPSQLVIEVLETEEAPEMGALGRAIERWRAAGFGVAMDDAGPRLRHWRALMDLPFTAVKLDGALAAMAGPGDALAERIATEAKRRGMTVISEGIESAEDAARMTALGADTLQGFFYARPMPAMALEVWLGMRG